MTADSYRKHIEAGVFIPIANGGWVFSENAPDTPGTYDHNRQVTLLAEELGFDIALSMMQWSGKDSESRHWSHQLESLSLMAGLAEATSRIKLWGTAQVLAWHPVVAAKVIATIDQISHGRAGLNVVTGDLPESLAQLTQWNPDPTDGKYGLAAEWVEVARKYWSDETIVHNGKYFTASGAWASPKPYSAPKIACAGQSSAGFKFTAESCDYAFFVGSDDQKAIERMLLAKQMAREAGNAGLRTMALFTLIPESTDERAQSRVDYYNAGTDMEWLNGLLAPYKDDTNNEARKHFARQVDRRESIMDGYLAGSYDTIAQRITTAVQGGDLDGIMVIVPDFINDLRVVADEVFPRLAENGITSNIAVNHDRSTAGSAG
ncbi:hypothetical protein ASC61_10410 [Aeromicrobium sp. Root344]|uniref:LLM class flavin-dependent oxidoreductase n=1 Tax=Aeromicrobium sp. Root344 TaxID=1736521 RepID=UPI0006F61F75|nr:LLM class flavin-dependent oxidoreductase [Aeromicrobium sp. Root344]KQV75381.1 hypothetical protein ASC61_10410 [Aeromicrobium sp. Root344]